MPSAPEERPRSSDPSRLAYLLRLTALPRGAHFTDLPSGDREPAALDLDDSSNAF